MRSTRPVILTTLLCVAGLRPAMSQPPGEPGQHRAPPPEAIQACEGTSSGMQCSFTTDRGSMTGTCWAPEGKPLACKPAGNPPSGSAPPAASKPPQQ